MRPYMSRGAALPVVLFALAMASALAVGGLFVARRLVASAQTSQRGSGIETVAESILVMAVANWDSAGAVESTDWNHLVAGHELHAGSQRHRAG